MAKKKRTEEDPEFVEVTARERINGIEKDKNGRRKVIEQGEDFKCPYRLALRLERSGKVAIDDDDRDAAKIGAATNRKAQEDADHGERRRIQDLDDRIAERDKGDSKKRGKKG
jgi:hypothetical protein